MWFALLGRLTVTRDTGEEIPVAGIRLRVLLAVLLLHANEPVSSDTLADAVWDGSPPPGAVGTLRSHVLRLRRVLGPEAGSRIEARHPGYLIQAHASELDVVEFEDMCRRASAERRASAWRDASASAARALDLWRGAPLVDVPSWAAREAFYVPRLEQLHLQVLEDRVEADLHLGRHARLVPELRELTARYPLRERLHAQLMMALAGAGRPAEALDAYQAARGALVEQLGIDPGPELRDLHARVLTGDSTLATTPADHDEPHAVPAARPRAVPRQLPSCVAYFVGRDAAMKALTTLAGSDSGAVVISAIGGAAGIGKTALAVHWAHQNLDKFPDGQLYVNLRGYGPERPLTPADALDQLLRGLGVGGAGRPAVPAELDAKVAMYRSGLADKRMLIVLDNARATDQVRPLLPGSPGCLALVTSRDRLSGLVALDGAVPLALDLLTHDEATDLLTRRLGRERIEAERESVDELIEFGARLPLAMNIVAARAALRPRHRISDLVHGLRDACRRLDLLATEDGAADVRTAFSWSYQAMSEDAASMFRLLGLHPGPDITVAAAASLAATDRDRAESIMDELAAAHLLDEHVTGRYRCHDLLHDYAVDQANTYDPQDARHEAFGRILDHYAHSGHAAAGLLPSSWEQSAPDPPRAGVTPETFADDEAVRWFDDERQVLLAVIASAYDQGMNRHVCQLARSLANILDREGHWNELAATQSLVLCAAEHQGDQREQANAHRLLGRADSRRALYGSAYEHFRAANELFRRLGDPGNEAFTHLDTAWTLEQEARYQEAANHARQALELHRRAGNELGQALALNVVAWYRSLLGEHEQALIDCEQAMELNRKCGNISGEAFTWSGMGHAQHHLGRHQEAVICYHNALDLFGKLNDRYMQAQILNHLGDTYHASHDTPAAHDTWHRALRILDQLRHHDADTLRSKMRRA